MKIPEIHPIDKISFTPPEAILLSNQLQLYGFNGAKNDILRLELVFDSGRWTEPAPLIAESVAKLFKSGTSSQNSFELNEAIENYGSTIRASAGYNTFTISVYCLNRFLAPTLQLLRTCLTDIVFPQKEIDLMQQNALARLKVSKEKNDYLAEVAFKKNIYGAQHPYGMKQQKQLYSKFRKRYYSNFIKMIYNSTMRLYLLQENTAQRS